jgi:pre-mRNA-splicing factor RBM22/SLT11
LLDLEYGLPAQVRDTALGVKADAPSSEINREYYAQNMEAKVCPAGGLDLSTNTDDAQMDSNGMLPGTGSASTAGKEMLKKLARQAPYYKRNAPQICSFFVKGECNRGDQCPYRCVFPCQFDQLMLTNPLNRHEIPEKTELSNQKLQDRYHGRNDPVAHKILIQHAADVGLAPPEDKSISAFMLASLPLTSQDAILFALRQAVPKLKDEDLRGVVYVQKSNCAFINFKTRKAAEEYAKVLSRGLEIGGKTIGLRWARPRPKKNAGAAAPAAAPAESSEAAEPIEAEA